MKLTIDIPRSEYEDICHNAINYKNTVGDALLKAIALGEEQKTGYWIDREIYDADRWKCSECGRTEPYKENYCPNCGCRMVEPQESEDKG